ncbi:MAG: nickel-responsive transcriptional regulator NikR [Actinomycetota bacterium]|jgi:CopG family nickel-responsive transcriptional regulator|nr:nickel-responsive transcriptional regulator NikR [Actinomycetota bacterium]
MEKVKRFGVSIEENLLKKFDSFIKDRKYKNRSEAIRDLIREKFVDDSWEDSDRIVAGAIIIVYDHKKRELLDKLVRVQHEYLGIIISSQHIHLDHHNCMEIIVVKGTMARLTELEAILKATRGVKHTTFAKSTLGDVI